MTNIHRTCLGLIALCSFLKSRPVQTQDLYASLSDMEPLLKTHKKIIDALHDYIIKEKMRHRVLETYLKHYRKEHEKALANIQRYLENPVRAFKLIRRLTVDLEFIGRTVYATSPYHKYDLIYPQPGDLIGAAQALTRLRNTYQLNITELTDGILKGTFSHDNSFYTESVTSMSASDCYYLGMTLYSTEDFSNGLLWLLEAYNKFQTENHEGHNFDAVDLIDHITFGYHMRDDVLNTLKWVKKLVSLRPSDVFIDLMKEYEERLAKEEGKRRHVDTNKTDIKIIELILTTSQVHPVYEAACRGEIEVPKEIVKSLKCRYLTENHPFLKLAPIKMEQLYLKPEVILFHEVMSDQEIKQIRNLAKPKLQRVLASTDDASPAPLRVSKDAWLKDQDSDVVAHLSQRISDFTGLSLESSENLQVNNYGIGGYYGPHYDILNKTSLTMATVLLYMSDVAQGGATVFTELGLTVFPVRGAALFWRNMLPSGEKDLASGHAACPVLRGDKWVSNKWIHQRGQELRRPCNLEQQKENSQNIAYNSLHPPAHSLAF